jgi:glycosyltransferase involved in cell wall biosynthesis
VFIGFLAQPIVPFAILRRRKPLVVDMFISLYETLSDDRGRVAPNSITARLARWLDSLACRRAAKVLTDTAANAEYLIANFGARATDVTPLFVGTNEQIFQPQPPREPSDRLLVLYYATYLPLHGVDVVVRAAKLLENDGVEFRLIGRGMERSHIDRLAAKLAVRNCQFVDWTPYERLPAEIAAADICLAGHFAAGNEKARRVIPGKAFQLLAMAKPTVLGESPATTAAFDHGKDCYLVPMGDPEALAGAIRQLRDDPQLRTSLGEAGRELFLREFSSVTLAARLGEILPQVLPAKPR